MNIGLLLFPNLTQLDLTGPAEVFARMPGSKVHLVSKSAQSVSSDWGLTIAPTSTFATCPEIEVICVPGGPGQIELMDDAETLDFLSRVASTCRLVTSVCTGSLVLAAAGLLNGYRATCHWSSLDQLATLGAIPVAERVVVDRNRITGAGVTSGIDFALTVAADLFGPSAAEEIQLQMEYDPRPPFSSGSPRLARPEVVAALRRKNEAFMARRRAATELAAARLGRRD